MTAGHDGREPDVADEALLAAITGEPLSERARTDAEFLAAHRAATADVALLRRHLGLVADALTAPAPAAVPASTAAPAAVPAPVRPGAPRRRPFALALRAVAVAAAGALVVGTGWLVVRAGNAVSGGSAASDSAAKSDDSDNKGAGAEAAAGAALESPQYLACARLVVEGDVTDVEPVAGTAQSRVTLHVTRSYKPAKAPAEVGFLLEREVGPDARPGEHVLVVVPQHSALADAWITGADAVARERAVVGRALPDSRTLTCE
ncbi:hypothetical protein FNH09_36765 [Streptomyces adustus]|uniref:Uncharacterized protein n=1 Tax=Streptomyces adustus TaxID=1609272 RepID=A0A5N8VP95_9ACTN|nr:hypothetical protein [Streptomyces adustus]MPY36582.1 hypothetical protein [Streptomyces adustus]